MLEGLIRVTPVWLAPDKATETGPMKLAPFRVIKFELALLTTAGETWLRDGPEAGGPTVKEAARVALCPSGFVTVRS